MVKNLSGRRKAVIAIAMLGFCVLAGSLHAAQDTEIGSASGNTVTLLPDGTSLVLGGMDTDGRVQPTATIRTPSSASVTALSAGLSYPRAWHTATVLPNGTVLIQGGVGPDGKVVVQAEVFDPVAKTFAVLASGAPTPRAFHTATLLTDGCMLIAGGISVHGEILRSAEIWDFRQKRQPQIIPWATARRSHSARLLANGMVLFEGGQDAQAKEIGAAVFDPNSETIVPISDRETLLREQKQLTEVKASSPEDGAVEVPTDILISMRFSSPVQMASITSQTIALKGPNGNVDANIVPAEGGMLAFITPSAPLLSGSVYGVTLSGAADVRNASVPSAQFTFTTAGSPPSDPEHWQPNADWRTHAPPSPYEQLPLLQAPPGVTALAGRVLRLDGKPLPRVTLQIGQHKSLTDESGRFLILNINAGHQVLRIDATTANHGTSVYGLYEAGVEIVASKTNALSYTIWMTALDKVHEVTIPSPTVGETVVTNPVLPGLELHIPPNTVIVDSEGKPVTKITMTPIPLDRTPFPLPPVNMPIYFTIQPGLSYIKVLNAGSYKKGARLIYPNSISAIAGTIINLWDYDADGPGWFVYGQGKVDADRAQIVPFPGVEIYEFTGASVADPEPVPLTGRTAGCKGCRDGEPVDLSTGLFVYNKTDLVVSDVIPLALTRTYRPNDSISRAFGIGATHPYDIFIAGDNILFGFVDLVLPDGSRIRFDCNNLGNGGCQPGPHGVGLYSHTTSPTEFYRAILEGPWPDGSGWKVTMKNGTVLRFPFPVPASHSGTNPFKQALTSITDRYGNTVTINRDTGGQSPTNRAMSIVSPNGRYITFTYDSFNHIVKATNNGGQTVNYAYDSAGRLVASADANAATCVANNPSTWMNINPSTGMTVCPTTTYTYDGKHRMLTVTDPKGILYLTNQYDDHNRVAQQTLADGSVYTFDWVTGNETQGRIYFDAGGSGGGQSGLVIRYCPTCYAGFMPLVAQVDVYYPYQPKTDPRNYHRQVKFGNTGYMTDDNYAVGTAYEQDFHYDNYADNLVQKIRDPLNNITTYDYDTNGNLSRITWLDGSSAPATTTYSYDTAGFNQLLSMTEDISPSLQHTYSFSYDNKGNMRTASDPLGNTYTFTYNSNGQILTATDALRPPSTANTSTFTYNNFGDLVAFTDPLQNTTRFTPDSMGRLLSVTDALNQTTSYLYDSLDQPIQVTDPRGAGGATSFTYDANGNLLTVQDPSQQGTNLNTSYSYDNLDRVVVRTDPLARQEFYQYDLFGNLTQYTDKRGSVTTLQYDALNRLTLITFGTESSISYSYDSYDRLVTALDSAAGPNICPPANPAANFCYSYNDLTRTYSETTPQGSVNYTSDYAGRRKSMTIGAQQTDYTFDIANRLTRIHQGSSSAVLAYDEDGRRTSLTLPNNVVTTNCYDSNSRLTGLFYGQATSCQNPSGTLGTLLYGYDALNRRTQAWGTFARTGLPQPVGSASYDAANELLQWNGQLFNYDLNGNMISDGTNALTWDARNQLVQFNAAGLTYDAFGRRTQNIAGTSFFYDGANVVKEFSGMTQTATRFTGDLDEFFSRTDSSGNANMPLTDALRSTIALVNSSGSVTTNYSYDPFGNTTASGSSNTNPFQYSGRENDGNGLYYFRNRYYSSQLGRFISEDPVGFEGGLNFYSYAIDSPMSFTDPFGTCIINVFFESEGRAWPFIHSYIVVTDNSHTLAPNSPIVAREFRGGEDPDQNDMLTAEFDPMIRYPRPSFPDLPENAIYSFNLITNKCPCTRYANAIQRLDNQIAVSGIIYQKKTTNSNAVVSRAIRDLGMNRPEHTFPKRIRARLYGWNYPLPLH